MHPIMHMYMYMYSYMYNVGSIIYCDVMAVVVVVVVVVEVEQQQEASQRRRAHAGARGDAAEEVALQHAQAGAPERRLHHHRESAVEQQ